MTRTNGQRNQRLPRPLLPVNKVYQNQCSMHNIKFNSHFQTNTRVSPPTQQKIVPDDIVLLQLIAFIAKKQ